jgi:hypothetical protein
VGEGPKEGFEVELRCRREGGANNFQLGTTSYGPFCLCRCGAARLVLRPSIAGHFERCSATGMICDTGRKYLRFFAFLFPFLFHFFVPRFGSLPVKEGEGW